MPNIPSITVIRDQAALAVLCVAQTSPGGAMARVRLGLQDFQSKTIWYLSGQGENGSTSLRRGQQTGIDTITVIVPRQQYFKFDIPIVSGMIIELEIGSQNWYSVERVDYCAGTPSTSPIYTLTCAFAYNDPTIDT
jgi:hypothetical protein